MAARRNTEPEPFKFKEKPGNLITVTAGVNRSGLRRVGQLTDFESSQEPTACLQTDLSVSLPVVTADPLESLLPPQTGLSARVCDEIESGQLEEGGNSSEVQVQVQYLLERDAVSTDLQSDSGNISVIMAGETEKNNDKEVTDKVVLWRTLPLFSMKGNSPRLSDRISLFQ